MQCFPMHEYFTPPGYELKTESLIASYFEKQSYNMKVLNFPSGNQLNNICTTYIFQDSFKKCILKEQCIDFTGENII